MSEEIKVESIELLGGPLCGTRLSIVAGTESVSPGYIQAHGDDAWRPSSGADGQRVATYYRTDDFRADGSRRFYSNLQPLHA